MRQPAAFVELRHVFVDFPSQKGLSRIFGRKPTTHSVLRDINLHLEHGTWVTLFGRPGAGKSTLLRLLSGVVPPSRGRIRINGQLPSQLKSLAAGYVSSQETEPDRDTVNEVLHTFGHTHHIQNLPARVGAIAENVGLGSLLYRPTTGLSSTERLRLNLARAALSDSPLVLLDDVADELGISELKQITAKLFEGKILIIATRFTKTAEKLQMPVLLLHNNTLAHYGTCDDIADNLACPRVVDVWVEGLRYDLLRRLRQHAGVAEARLVPDSRFAGQRVRITLRSARYLPAMYDLVSQAPLIRIEELPASLSDILSRL